MRQVVPLLLLPLLLSGCAANVLEEAPGPQSELPRDDAPVPYQTRWTTVEVTWLGGPGFDGRGVWAGEMVAFAPREAEEGRILMYNMTLRAGSANVRLLQDGEEVASGSLTLGGTDHFEIAAGEKSRYWYEFWSDLPGGGSIEVAYAVRGVVSATTGSASER